MIIPDSTKVGEIGGAAYPINYMGQKPRETVQNPFNVHEHEHVDVYDHIIPRD